MKRKVRIYKDPFGNGGYINKTAQWLRKADEGIQTGPTPVTQGIMQQMQSGQPQQAMQQQPEQDPQEQILQAVVALAQKGYGQDEIKDYLLQEIYGFDKASQEYAQYEPQILEFVSAVFEKSAPEGEEQEVTNDPIADIVEDTSMQDTSEEDGNYDQMINDIIYDDDDQEARYGGVPNKRSYVNKLVRQLRKAAKGDQVEEANTADVRGTEDNPTGTTGNKNMFVAGVKGQAENHFLKQQAEQMYNNQFGQGMPQPGMQQPQGDMDFAQRGGWRMRRANRKMFGSPNLPLGVTSSKYSFGPLGGVRSAEVQFNPLMMASMFPMMTFPGMGGGSSWGYNQPYRKTTKGRLVTERIASNVNNKSTEDVANATDSDAATTAAEPKTDVATTNADGTVTVDTSGGTGTAVTPDESSNTDPFEVNGARQAMELKNKKSRWSNVTMKKDSWGRNEDSQWYGYDPKKKKYTEGPNKGKTTTQVKSKLEDKANKELIEKFGSKVKPYLEYESFQKNANTGERLLNQLGFYGPSDPSLHGGFTGDDALSYVAPMGLKGAAEAFKLTPAAERILRGERLNIGSDMAASFRDPKAQQAANAIYKNFYKSVRSGAKGLPEPPPGTQLKFNFAAGGFVNNPMQDQFGNLQKFIYGDQVDDQMLENLFQPPINQSDLDYSDSKDVTDPYFKHGGLHRYAEGDEVDEPKTYNQEELDKILADKQKSWETDYQNKTKTAQQKQQEQQMRQYQNMQQYMNPMGSRVSGYGYRGAPMGGFGGYGGPGLLGAAGRLAGSFMGGRQSQFSPMGNPLQYAATAAGITKAGMLPTGMKYSKEKKQDGNFFERKLGFNKDKTWTIDYATPEQIKAGVKPGTTPGATTPGGTSSSTTPGLSGKDRRIAARDERKNRGIPAEADAEAFTSTLKGSTEPEGPSKNAQQELINFQANQRRQGLTIDPKTQKWVKGDSPLNNINASPGMSRFQEADIVTGTPGVSVEMQPSKGTSTNQGSRATPGKAINGMVESPGMVGKTDAEIREALIKGESIPTVVNKGNTTYINAAGTPIDLNDPIYSDTYAYGGYIPEYMAYGGYIPMADQGINVSSVAYEGNPVVGVQESPTWGAMQYFNQNQNIKNPDADKFKNYTVEPDDDDLSDCTYEQKIDPTSKCYDPQTAQLKFKEEKGPAGQKAANIMGTALDFGALLADDMNYATERRTKYIPGMTEFARGEKQSANEGVNRGMWNARTGKEGDPQSFKGVIKKGGAIKNKKSNASGHKIDMNDFQSLLKLAGLI
jgi:hypothetical protein